MRAGSRSTPVTRVVPWRVVDVRVLPDWGLAVRFADGTEGEVDLSPLVNGGSPSVFSQLRDAERFASVTIEHGAVAWPGGLDLAPDAMYRTIRENGRWVVE